MPSPFTFTITLILSLFVLGSYATPRPGFGSSKTTQRETNAQRLARGLPPLRPSTFGGATPGFGSWWDVNNGPTSVKRSRASASPSPFPISHTTLKDSASEDTATTYVGRIQVRNSAGNILGYVKNWSGESSVNGINYGTSNEDAHVSFTTTSDASDLINIVVTDPNFTGPVYLGARSSSLLKPILSSGSSGSVEFLNVPKTSVGSKPSIIPGTNGQYLGESAIWKFDSQTNQLTPRYINPDGSIPSSTFIAYRIRENELFFVGDVDAWNTANSGYSASQVEFYFEQS